MRLRSISVGVFFSLAMIFAPSLAAAKTVVAKIDISDQVMRVYVNGVAKHSWPVSTARQGYRTPVGTFKPVRMHKTYFSKKYNGAPMPHSVFFYKGYAIHGTDATKRLGSPASHGCIRLHPNNAARLFSLIKKTGTRNSKIVITK